MYQGLITLEKNTTETKLVVTRSLAASQIPPPEGCSHTGSDASRAGHSRKTDRTCTVKKH